MSSIYDDIDLDAIEAEYNATAHQREGYGREDRAMLRRLNPEKYDSDSRLKDTALDLGQGVMSIADAALGLGDLVSGGAATKWARDSLGYDSARIREDMALDYSFKRQDEEAEMAAADGFFDTVGTYITNPMMALGHGVQQVPTFLALGGAGGLGAKGAAALTKAQPYLSGVYKEGLEMAAQQGLKYQAAEKFAEGYAKRIAAQHGAQWGAAIGEGAITTGSVASAISQKALEEGRDPTMGELAYSIPAGLTTAAIGKYMGGRGGGVEAQLGARMSGSAIQTAGEGSFLKSVRSGFMGEAKEEMAQSAQEQIWQNLGTGEDAFSGVTKAMGQGAVMGGAMGGVFGGVNHFAGRAKDTHNIIGGANPTAAEAQASSEGEAAATQEIDMKVNSTLQAIQNSPYGALQGANPVDTPVPMADPSERLLPSQMPAGGVEELVADLRAQGVPESQIKKHIDWMQANGQLQQPGMASNEVPRPRTSAISVDPSEQRYRDFQTHQLEDKVAAAEAAAQTPVEEAPKQTLGNIIDKHGMMTSTAIGAAVADDGKLNEAFQRLSPSQQRFVDLFVQASKDVGRDKFTPKELANVVTAAQRVPYEATDDQLRQTVANLSGTDERYDAMKKAMGPVGSIQTVDERMGNTPIEAPVEEAPKQAIATEAVKAEPATEAKTEEAPKPRRQSMKRDPIKRNSQAKKDIDITGSMKDSSETDEYKVFKKASETENDASKKANPEDKMSASRIKSLIKRAVRGDFKDSSYENASDVADALIHNLSDRTLAAVHKWLGSHTYTSKAFARRHGGGKLIHSRIGFHLAKKAPTLLPENDNVVAEQKDAEAKSERRQARRERNPLEGIGVATKAEPVNYNKLAYEMPPVDANFDTAVSLANNKTEKHILQRAKDTYDMLASGELRMFESKRGDGNYGQVDKDGVALPMIRISAAKDIQGYQLLGGGKLSKEDFAKIFSYLYWQDRKRLNKPKEAEDDTTSVRENIQYTRTDKDTLAEFGKVNEDGDFDLDADIKDYTGGDTRLSKYNATAKKVSNALKDSTLDPEEAADAAIDAFDEWVDYVFNSSELKGTGSEPKGNFVDFFSRVVYDKEGNPVINKNTGEVVREPYPKDEQSVRKVYFADGMLDAASDEDMLKKFGPNAKNWPVNGVRIVRNKNGEILHDEHGFERRAFVPPTAVSKERLMQWTHIANELGKFIAKSGRPADARAVIKDKIWQHVKDNYIHYEPFTDETGDAALDDYHTELDNVRILVAERLALNFNLGISGALARGEKPTAKWLGKMETNGAFSTQVKEGLADGVGEGADSAIASFKALVDELFTSQQRKKLEDLSIEARVDFLEGLANNPFLELRYDPSTGYKFVISGTRDDGLVVSDFRPGDILLPQWVRNSGLLSEATLKSHIKDKRSRLGKLMLKAQRNYDARAVGNAFGMGEAAMYQNMYSEISKDYEVPPHIVNAKQMAHDNLVAALHVAGAKARTDLAVAQVMDVVDTYARLQTQLTMLREEYHLIQRDDATRKLFAKREKDLEELISQCYQEMVIARNAGANMRVSKEKLATRKDVFDKALNEYVNASQAFEGELARLRVDAELSSALEKSTLEKNLEITAQAKKDALENRQYVRDIIGDTTGDDIYDKYAGADAPVTIITYDGETVETNPGIAAQTLAGNIFDALYVREGFQSRERAIGWAIAKTLPHIVGNTANPVKARELLKAIAVVLDNAYEYESVAMNNLDERMLTQKGVLEGIFSNRLMQKFQKEYPTAQYDKGKHGLTTDEVADVVTEIRDLSKRLSSEGFRGLANREAAIETLRYNLQTTGTHAPATGTRYHGTGKKDINILALPRLKFSDLQTAHPVAHSLIGTVRDLLVKRGRTSGYIGRVFGNFQFAMHPEGYGPDASVTYDAATGSTLIVLPSLDAPDHRALVSIAHEIAHVLLGDLRESGVANSKAMEVSLDFKTGRVVPVGQAAKELMQLVEKYPLAEELLGDYPLSNIAYVLENGEYAPEVLADMDSFFTDPKVVQSELLAQISVLWMFSKDAAEIINNEAPALAKILSENICNGGNPNGGPTNSTTKNFRGNARKIPSPQGAMAQSSERQGSNRRISGANGSTQTAVRGSLGKRTEDALPSGAERVEGSSGANGGQGPSQQVSVAEKQVTQLSKAVKATFKETSKAKVEDAISKLPPEWQNAAYSAWDMVRGFLGNLLEKLQLGLSFTKDLAAKFSEVMPSIGKLMETMQEKEAWQNAMQETLARFRNRFAAFDKPTQDAINKCLEASTLSRVWAYRPDWVSDETWKASQDNEKFAQIQAQFNALPAAAQQFVKDAFEKNHQLFVEKMDILTNKTNELFDDAIENATDEADKQSLIEDKKTALARITKLRPDADWPYMPLVRRGSHAVVARSQALRDAEHELEELTQRRIDEKGLDAEDSARVRELRKAIEKMRGNESDYIVMFVNGQGSANQAQRKLQGLHPDMHVEAFERRIETTHDAINFMSINALEDQLTARMGESNSDSNRKLIRRMLTMLNDIYIDNLADKHSRKAELHRENVAGYNPDMVANFLDQGYRETNYLGGVRYNKQIRDAMRTLQSEARMSDKGVPTDVRMRVYNEILKRQQLDYEHKPNAFVETTQRITSLSMLLLSPAYYLQNATQPFMMSAPYMAGKHNVDKVFSHLANDMKSIAQMYFDAKNRDGVAPRIDQMFKDNPALLKALEEARAAGRIDIGMAQDFGHLQNASPFQRATDKISNVARLTEMLNRVATFKTAFELELERTGSAELAKVYADEVLYETHGDYSNTNAPRFFRQGGMGLGAEKLIFQFRKFQLIQLGMMCRLVKNAFANADTNERKIARKALAYTMGTHMAFTGMKGTPFVMFLLAAMGLGDDDENEEDAIRRLIGDKATSDFLLGGVPAALGLDVSGRIGAGTMLSPFPFLSSKPWDSREAANEFWVSFGGPALAQANRMFEGMSYINEGDIFKGFEKMVPNGVGNAMRAYRFATEGYTTKNGTVTIPSSEFDAMETFFQAIGLPTSVTTDRMRLQDKLIRSEEYFAREERKLNKAYRAATSAKERMEVQREYIALQKKRAEKGFTPKPVTQLVKNAKKVEKDAKNNVGGVIANNSNRGLLEMWSKW